MTAVPLHIVGGGLAGCEAAWQAAQRNVPVVLHEMRPHKQTASHTCDTLAELVCSNSFRSDDQTSAIGLLHEEMRRAGSLILEAADANRLPAGGALAVDRTGFSHHVEQKIAAHPNIALRRGEIREVPLTEWPQVIVATGPLTSNDLAEQIREWTGGEQLAFFDAIAPIVYRDTINMDMAWCQSRYDKGEGADYINCPLDRDQYEAFIDALLSGECTDFKEWERDTPYFESCLPIEVMAARGRETLRFGPMKPVGLTNAHDPGRKPYAVVQLRQDNALGTLFNMVGFQTKLRYQEQVRIFRTIPGLEGARFARLGGLHRNTFINSPRLLDHELRLKQQPKVRFAGQITGVEGYVESAAMGLLAGRFAAAELAGQERIPPPRTTAIGALLSHITENADADTFQPMNINFGLFPEVQVQLEVTGKRARRRHKAAARRQAYASRALTDIMAWEGRQSIPSAAAE